MTRALLSAALALAIAMGGWGWWQHQRAQAATARAETAEALVAGYAEVARMRAAQDAVLAAQRAEAAALDRDLATGEGADAPLSDYLGRAAERLWP